MCPDQGDTGRYYDCLGCGARHESFQLACPTCGAREFRTGRLSDEEPADRGNPVEELLVRLNPLVPR
jgi:DNA-directed RNA polymerase subunit RPC12/RpoP